MATINRENIGTLNDRITVTVKEEDYNPAFQKTLKEYSKNANIPGFRKGKVPAGLIKKMYGAELFPQEVLKAVESGLNDYLKEEKLDLFGQPMLQDNESAPKVDVNQPGDYSFNFEVGLKPELDLDKLEKSLKFTRYKVKPDDKEIDEEIEKLQQRGATFEELEEVKEGENVVSLSFQLADKAGNPAEEGEAEKREEKFRLDYFAPSLQEELKGKKKGDTLTVQLKDAFEEKELNWVLEDWKADKESTPENHYLLTVTKVEKAIPRELEASFFQEVYPNSGIATEADFRKKITEDFQAQWDRQAKHLLEHKIFEQLVNDTPMELPVDFLKKQLKTEGGKLKSEEEVDQQYPEFEKQTKWGIITSGIINKEKMEASPEEVKDFLRQQILGYFQMPAVTEENQAMVEELTGRLMQEEGRVDEAYRTILTNKLFDWLVEKADITDQEISTEEFIKITEEHNHEHHEHG